MTRKSMVMVAIGMMFVLSRGHGLSTSPACAEALLPIKIGYQSTSSDDWLLFAARDLKLFEKAGLAPELIPFIAGPPMIAAAKSNSIDVAIVKVLPFLSGLSQGVDWVMIGIHSEGAYSEGLVARRDSGIETPGDLRGKRVGYFVGTSAHYGLIMTLRQHGISRDQVTLVNMSPEKQMASLITKELDAAMVWEPWIQRMVHEGNARLIALEGDLGIYTNVASISVQREWLLENRETAVRFLRTLIMAYDALQKNHAVAIRAVAEETGTKKEWVEQIYRDAPPPNIHLWADSRYLYSLAKGSVFHRILGYVARFMELEQVFPKKVETDDVLDASIITEALKTIKRDQ